uniref:Uncharacterized protein n=1 Tax=Oryza sativa subsp. japonica TaxID=39947 RepID=Q6YS97_ORYSJ|nr:hypothetical protein [Oryza sativa Japonica Group]
MSTTSGHLLVESSHIEWFRPPLEVFDLPIKIPLIATVLHLMPMPPPWTLQLGYAVWETIIYRWPKGPRPDGPARQGSGPCRPGPTTGPYLGLSTGTLGRPDTTRWAVGQARHINYRE